MADSVAAVWAYPGSANQMLPRSFFQAPASTPPLMMGISTALIGLLPGQASWGDAAPIVLIKRRDSLDHVAADELFLGGYVHRAGDQSVEW